MFTRKLFIFKSWTTGLYFSISQRWDIHVCVVIKRRPADRVNAVATKRLFVGWLFQFGWIGSLAVGVGWCDVEAEQWQEIWNRIWNNGIENNIWMDKGRFGIETPLLLLFVWQNNSRQTLISYQRDRGGHFFSSPSRRPSQKLLDGCERWFDHRWILLSDDPNQNHLKDTN